MRLTLRLGALTPILALAFLGLAETLQADESVMGELRRIGAVPGGAVDVVRDGTQVRIIGAEGSHELAPKQARQIIVGAPVPA